MTAADLNMVMDAERLEEFIKWMHGQTVGVCDGRRYDYNANTFRDTGCGPHGPVYYRHDVARYLNNQPVID
jgi:hypothetical protein